MLSKHIESVGLNWTASKDGQQQRTVSHGPVGAANVLNGARAWVRCVSQEVAETERVHRNVTGNLHIHASHEQSDAKRTQNEN
jgi:hypothetical protein